MVSIPDTYRKVVVTELNIDFRKATEIIGVPMPELAPDEVLVKNRYAGVNASDINISAGVYSEGKPLPLDTGIEAAGEVVAIGSEVTKFEVGDPVVTSLFSGIGNGYREYFAAKSKVLIPAPDLVPGVLCLPIAAGTAHLSLYTVGEMGNGDEVVLITAAAGGVGHLAVQLAKLAGNHVIGTCGSPRKAQMLHDLGVDRVINYREEDVAQVIREEYPEQLTLVLENVGKTLFDVAVDNLATRGRLVINGYISEYKSTPDIIESERIYYKLLWKSASLRGFLMPHYLDDLGAALDDIFALYDAGKLNPMHDPTEFRGVEAVADAVEHLHAGQNAGKVVVTF